MSTLDEDEAALVYSLEVERQAQKLFAAFRLPGEEESLHAFEGVWDNLSPTQQKGVVTLAIAAVSKYLGFLPTPNFTLEGFRIQSLENRLGKDG